MDGPSRHVGLVLPPHEVDGLDAMARQMGVTRADLMRLALRRIVGDPAVRDGIAALRGAPGLIAHGPAGAA